MFIWFFHFNDKVEVLLIKSVNRNKQRKIALVSYFYNTLNISMIFVENFDSSMSNE